MTNSPFSNIVIDNNITLLQALQKLNENEFKILFIKKKNKIVGTLTDGDIRRILLKENNLKISIDNKYNKKFIFFFEKNFNEQKANIEMKKKSIFLVPILNQKMELKKIYFLNQSLEKKIDADVFILAGGRGKRMGALTEENPKPMLLLGGKPILEHIIHSFKNVGIKNFFISINYQGEKIKKYFENGKKENIKITYICETSPLGTAGSLSLIKKKSKNKYLIVINGDIYTKLNYHLLLNFHKKFRNNITICSRNYRQSIPYGVINQNYRLSKKNILIQEKPTYQFQVSSGIYVFNYKMLNNLKKNKYLDMHILLNSLSKNNKVGIFPIHEDLEDVGDLQSLQNANANFFK